MQLHKLLEKGRGCQKKFQSHKYLKEYGNNSWKWVAPC